MYPFYDTRGVTRWVTFEYQMRRLSETLGSSGVKDFLVTPTDVFVFGENGGVGKVVNFPTLYKQPLLPDGVEITRWDLSVNGYCAKIEKLEEGFYLGNVVKTPGFCFRDVTLNPRILWNCERTLAETLPQQLLIRLLSSHTVTSPKQPPVCLSSAWAIKNKKKRNK